MGLFDFLKKKDIVEKKPSKNIGTKVSSMESNGGSSQSKKTASIDDAINQVKEKYAVIESRMVITSPICPHCNNALEKMPGRNKNCPNCKNTIIVRTSPLNHSNVIINNDQLEEIKKLWAEYRYSLKWMKSLGQQYGVKSSSFIKKRRELTTKFGFEPNQPDVIWEIFNDLAIKMMNKTPVDYGQLSGLYSSQALFLYEDNKSFFEILQESNRMMLMKYQQYGITKVEIPAHKDSCEKCRKNGDRILTIERALKEMPIPRKDCTHEVENGKLGWCRCMYQPVLNS